MGNEESKILSCKECGTDFEFTLGEQTFYKDKNFPDPVRCIPCRKTKKDRQKPSK